MREILFRGQHRCKGEKVRLDGTPVESKWVYGGYCQYNKDRGIIYQSEPEINKYSVYADTVGQYTGLTDKNGTKIFEGDIVQNTANGNFGIVRWYDEHVAFVIHGINDNKTYWLFDNDFSRVRIVGNIYDEKLEVENGEISKANSN